MSQVNAVRCDMCGTQDTVDHMREWPPVKIYVNEKRIGDELTAFRNYENMCAVCLPAFKLCIEELEKKLRDPDVRAAMHAGVAAA